MNKYRLTPITENLQDHDWNASSYQGIIEVYANDKYDAQLVCFEATIQVAQVLQNNQISYCPWQQTRLVRCELVKENCQNKRGIISPKELRDEWLSRNNR